ncbi:MAG TPA: iron-sulfur cluster assembly scaffold protein [candidate division WOR-3 bacterium]|uniref:Iron-sulfur cluster assembly scaffold protein n=1 Tax=candidate division WOR-3 bacterium TaxID=2052148 RepID=A0A7V0T7E7_UNCW3|nr:iron-sulfur cluster assembly scaffold protein [candidate division WOR-3 bacterium]
MPGGELNDGPDAFDSMQEEILRRAAAVYPPKVMELWRNPQNAGGLEDPDGYACITGPCGDTMQIWLRVAEGRIAEATFWTDGCGPSIVCGSMVTILARGRTVEEAVAVDQQAVLDALGGLPEESRHCALLAVRTLAEAVGEAGRRKETR